MLTLQVLGQTVLGFRLSVAQILISLAVGALIEFSVAFLKDKTILWPASGLLTGNSTAFILRTPGTLHGDWWSTHGIWIFVGVVAVSMASKYLIRWRGRHIFNPSNLGLVLAFVLLGPQYTEPMDLFWIPIGPWMIATYAILVFGGLLIGWELKLLGLEIGFMAAFAAFAVLALIPVQDHCMVASWHVTPMCGWQLWNVLVTSPELLIFALFMMPDPRTVPDGQAARFVFGVVTALLAVLLIGPTALEFWTKTAILASLVIACASRFALARLLAPLEEGDGIASILRLRVRSLAIVGILLLAVSALPASAAIATLGPDPAAGVIDGSAPSYALQVGSGPGIATWLVGNAEGALPPARGSVASGARTQRIWVLPTIPSPTIASNVTAFDPSLTPQVAGRMAHDAVLDLVIESEARRAHDTNLAQLGASGDALNEFVDVINQDIAANKIVQKTYQFDSIGITLWLPKFGSQAPRLVGVTLRGTATLITRDAAGNVLAQAASPYAKTWGLTSSPDVGYQVMQFDFTLQGLAPAP
ncbi:MAG TPA: hypothetical protein VKE27_13325 [Candidatus Dormibacteraeota bacterium]|nr:hypothetical protein [Candidatus Dormibacteraeota bacterium]